MVKPSLSATVQKLRSISTLPFVAMRILQVTADQKSDASDLEDIIKTDPPLTSKILKMVNSAHFAMPQRILDVRRAVIQLGFRTVKDLAISASVCDLFKSTSKIGRYSRSELWKHCVAVAICAKIIAQKTNTVAQDKVFSLGILMDLGIIMIDQHLHPHFELIQNHEAAETTDLDILEREIMGFDHMDIAHAVAEIWKLPPEILSTMQYHHKPRSAPKEHQKLVSLMYLADTLCNFRKIGYPPTVTVDVSQFNFALTQLALTKVDVKIIREDLPYEIEKASDLAMMAEG